VIGKKWTGPGRLVCFLRVEEEAFASWVEALPVSASPDSDPYEDARGRWSSYRPYSVTHRYASRHIMRPLTDSTDLSRSALDLVKSTAVAQLQTNAFRSAGDWQSVGVERGVGLAGRC
jgi:hypothetical protein